MVERQRVDAVPIGETIGKAVERVAKERHKLPRQRQMLPRNSKGIQPLKKSLSFAGETVGTPACQSAYPCACRHTGIQAKVWWKGKGANTVPNGRNDGKSGGKGGQRTPQAATTTPNAATQRQKDTTLAKVIFLCRRNGRHAYLPAPMPAGTPARMKAGIPGRQAYREGCLLASPFAQTGGYRPDQETDV